MKYQNIAGCLVLYHPNKANIDTLSTYIDSVKKLYIFDNTETHSNFASLNNNEKLSYFWDGENKGIAIRLNQACKMALQEGYDYLLTMDQDSYFTENYLEKYIEEINTFENKNTVATFGLEYATNALSSEKKFNEVDHVITSGCILNLKLYQEIGGFDENLFIDYVDTDYCFNALSKGFRNIQFKHLLLTHSIGEIKKRKSLTSLYLKSKQRPIHAPIRIYYMWRNLLYMKKKYGNTFPENLKILEKRQRKYIYRCINYSENAWEAFKMFQKAKSDFKNNSMGKIKTT